MTRQLGCFGQPSSSTTADQLDVAGVIATSFDRRQTAAFAEREQQVLHRAGFELVGQLEPVGEQLVAVLVDETDVAGGDDLAARPVPADRVGADRLVLRAQDHVAGGGNDFGIAVVLEPVGLEVDLALAGGGGSRGGGGRRLRRGLDAQRAFPELAVGRILDARRLAVLRQGGERQQAERRKPDHRVAMKPPQAS